MKYFSEVTRKMYDSPEALEQAEQKVLEDTKNAKAAKARCAKAIEDAEERLTVATQMYDEAVKDFNLKCTQLRKELLDPAQKEINDATQAKYEALKEFSERYGVYTKCYSDEDIGSILHHLKHREDPFFNLLTSLF